MTTEGTPARFRPRWAVQPEHRECPGLPDLSRENQVGYAGIMHKSRIGGIFIDHPPSSFEASLRFWLAATGRELSPGAEAEDPYASLGLFGGDVVVELQRVGDGTQPRVHLDVDTDDVPAEVARLKALGARRLSDQDGGRFCQMVDPGGLVFCVIPPHTPDFEEQAVVWP